MDMQNNISVKCDKIIYHIEKNFNLYVISFIFILMGVFIGFLSVKKMSIQDRQYLLNWFSDSMVMSQENNLSKIEILIISIKNYIPVIIAFWFLGLTIIGAPIILLMDVIKGYILGYSFFFMVSNFNNSGVFAGIGGVLFQNVIFIPCIIGISVLAMEFSLRIIREKREKINAENVINYTIKCTVISLIMIIGCLIETFITPSVLRYLNIYCF